MSCSCRWRECRRGNRSSCRSRHCGRSARATRQSSNGRTRRYWRSPGGPATCRSRPSRCGSSTQPPVTPLWSKRCAGVHDDRRVAAVAAGVGDDVARWFADGLHVVVTGRAAATDFLVRKAHDGAECHRRMAALAALAAEDVGRRLGHRADARAGRMAGAAHLRGRLEHAVRMTAFAAGVAVRPGQLEAGGQVVEGRWRLRGDAGAAGEQRTQHQQQIEQQRDWPWSLLRPRPVEGNRRVAAVAASTELAQVHVVGRVAGRAVAPEPRLAGRALMAGVALQARVRAAQREAALLLVVETARRSRHSGCGSARSPRRGCRGARHRPRGSRRSREGASLNRRVTWQRAQGTATCWPSSGKSVTGRGRSGRRLFQAAVPWQFSQFVPCDPACTSTARWQATHCCAGLWSAAVAVWQLWQASVACAPRQRELGVALVHEAACPSTRSTRGRFRTWRPCGPHGQRRRPRGSRRSPRGSLSSKRPLRWQDWQAACRCAPEQREAGFLLVVELRVSPGGLRVAVGAGGAARAAVHVVGRMAAGAGRGRVLPAVGRMAGGAGNLRMPRLQREARLAVVDSARRTSGKFRGSWRSRCRACPRAARPCCGSRRSRSGASRNFLPAAWQPAQATSRCAPSSRKSVCAWSNAGGITGVMRPSRPEVLAVTGAALGAGDLRTPAVEAALVAEVRGDVLVAGRAAAAPAARGRRGCGSWRSRTPAWRARWQRAGHQQAFQRRAARAAGETAECPDQHTAQCKPPCAHLRRQYTCTATTCTMPATSSMKNSGRCSTCHSENSRS